MTEMCHEVRDAIALEGRAPDREEVQKHVAECPDCARFLKSVLAVEGELGALLTTDVSDETVAKLLARPELSSEPRSHKLHWAMGLAAAATIAFVASRVTLMGQKSFDVEQLRRESEVAVLRDRLVVGDDKESQLEGDELSPEQLKDLRSLGYIDALSENRPDEQRAAGKTAREQSNVGEMPLSDEDTSAPQKSRVREPNPPVYLRFRSGTARLENKNEVLKKDNELGIGVGFVGTAIERRVDTFAETVVVTTESPLVDSTSAIAGSDVELDVGEVGGFTTIVGGQVVRGNYQLSPEPTKLVHVDVVYPEAAKQKRASGSVALVAMVDRDGNVTQAVVVESVEHLDQAAIDAVMQWKYEASDRDQRAFRVQVVFEAPSDPNDDARLFLEERERIDGLRFQDPRGYWANTYLPGDPRTRFLAMRLRNAHQLVAPHRAARPVVQPFDAPRRGALSLTLHADHRSISEPRRLLVQIGLQATESHGRRRPPMNVGIVLDAKPSDLAAARALIDSLQEAKALGDRFRLILPGKGEIVSPESFRHGPLSVALDELETSSDLTSAVRLAIEQVHAGDDPTMPLGSSLVLVVTPRKLGEELDALIRLAHQSAVGGVPVSVIGIGADIDRSELERLALAGQGRRYFLEQASDANSIVDRELAASSRVVARALRLRIKLAEGVKLVDVIGSASLSERQSKRVREAEKSIDLRLARNLGIEADRGEDEDGIQIVIPSFYAGDSHTILLDVVATRPGPIVEVTARYKDLTELRNTVAQASLALPRSTSGNLSGGALETNVLKNYLAFHLSEVLEGAADKLERGDRAGAIGELDEVRRLLTGLPFVSDAEIHRDVAMLGEYIRVLSSSVEPALVAYLADSLRYASASKRRLPQALT